MKQCKKCNTEKNENDFYNKDNTCKDCRKKLVKENRLKNIEYYLEYDKARANRPDRVEARKKYAKTQEGLLAGNRAKENWNKNNLTKRSAHWIVNNAVRNGRIIKPNSCETCGKESTRIDGHHDDYAYPLSVRWLCPTCHSRWHKKNGNALNG